MRAVVLVGGFGTRLRPLTNSTPKALLPVGHRPILELLVSNLQRAGIDDVVLSIGFRPDAFLAAYPDGRCGGVSLHYAVEPEPLDTGGAIAFAARDAGIDDTFVVVNGDVLTDLDVAMLVERHRRFGGQATIHLTPVDDPSAFGVVTLDEGGRVLRFVEKPPRDEAPSNLINAGTYVFEPEVLDHVPLGARVSVERKVFPELVAESALHAVATEDYWLDAGRPDLYLQANLDVIDGVRAWLHAEPVAPDAAVSADVTIDHCVVGAGARVARRARLTDSLLLAGARVGEGAVVERSVLGAGASVGAGVRLHRAILGDGVDVPAGERLVDTSRPAPE